MSELTVVTWNTYLCRVFGWNLCPEPDRRTELIREEVERADPDILCLQEAWDPKLAERVMSALPNHHVTWNPTKRRLQPMNAGLMIASRLPIRRAVFLPICSTLRPKELLAQRGLLTAVVEMDGRALAITSTHLGVGLSCLRRRQQRAFLDAVRGIDLPQVICGDFNVSPQAWERRRFPALGEMQRMGFRDTMAEVHGAAADGMVTVDSINPLVQKHKDRRIDYIWVKSAAGATWQVCDARVTFNTANQGLYPSDHYGVSARLMLTKA